MFDGEGIDGEGKRRGVESARHRKKTRRQTQGIASQFCDDDEWSTQQPLGHDVLLSSFLHFSHLNHQKDQHSGSFQRAGQKKTERMMMTMKAETDQL